jgi:enoyl-CoA hydratase/carnithine racemase
MPQLKLGISTVIGCSQRLPRVVGHGNASRIILGTETMTAARVY